VSVFSKSQSERDAGGLNGGKGDVKPEVKATNGTASPDTVSTLAHGVLVTGNIVSEGTLQICGRVNGDIHASHLIVKKGAQVEGNIVAQETIILGACKGIIHSNSVKLQDRAAVEGEIYSKSLTIEQDAQFEGVSRRLDKPVDAPASTQALVPAKVTLAPDAAPVGAMAEKMDA
jgi:cytoskeletal protein CcmA (bactofilin family)